MGGKEREREPPPATDDEDATQATTQEGDHAGRRRAGVIRQAQPTAQHHQITAGLASGAKRRAAAMSQGERAAKRMTDQRRRRHEQRGKSQPAPITFDAAVAKVASEAALGVAEVEDFRDWLLDPQQAGQPINGDDASPSGAHPKRTSAPGSSTWTVACARVRARAPTMA